MKTGEDHAKKLYKFGAEIALFDKSRIYSSLLAFKQQAEHAQSGFELRISGSVDGQQ